MHKVHLIQLYKKGKFKRYLRDTNNIPYTFIYRGDANLFAGTYLDVRNKKSLSIKVVEIEIKLPQPTEIINDK